MTRSGKIPRLRILSSVCLIAGATLLIVDWQRFLLLTLALMVVAIISSVLEIKRILFSSFDQEHREALRMLKKNLPNHTSSAPAETKNHET